MEYTTSRQYTITEDIYASHGQRIANFLIDYVIQLALFAIYGLILGVYSVMTGHDIEEAAATSKLEDYLYGILVALLYYGVCEALLSRTIAKFITKTIVVNEYGEKPTTRQFITRTFCRLIPFDGFSFLGTPSRGWHDSISDTYVVKKDLLDRNRELFNSFEEIGKVTSDE